MSLITMIGLFLLWQPLVLWGALRLVRFGRIAPPSRFPRPARTPVEFATGEWREDSDPVVEHSHHPARSAL
jgi:hypothetical protein